MIGLFRNRNYLAVWSGQTVSAFGDMVMFVALPIWVYQLTGSKTALGLSFAFEVLPRLLIGPLAGVFVDRWDRRRTLIAGDLIRGLLLLALLLLPVGAASAGVSSGPAGGSDPVTLHLVVIYAVAFASACVSRFYYPAKSALIPRLMAPSDLVAANSLSSLSDSGAQLLGPVLGTALVTLTGPKLAFAVNMASFLFSAAAVSMVRLSLSPRARTIDNQAPPVTAGDKRVPDTKTSVARACRELGADLAGGARLAWSSRSVRSMLLTFAVIGIAQGAMVALLLPYLTEGLGLTEDVFGWVVAAEGAGALIGGLAIGGLARKANPEPLYGWSILGAGTILGAIVWAADLRWLIGGLVLEGLVGVGSQIGAVTILQTRVPDEFRGRVHSLWIMMTSTSMVGMSVSGFLADRLGTVAVLAGAAGLIIPVSIFALVTMRPPAPATRGAAPNAGARAPNPPPPGSQPVQAVKP